MGLLNVSAEEWQIANDFFCLNKSQKKLLKTGKSSGFSFIKVDDKLYAMANGTYLGEGGFSKYKIAEDEHGANFAVGIRGQGIDPRVEKQIAAMKILGKFIGIMERDLGEQKQFWKNSTSKSLLTTKKTYLIAPLELGVNLFDRIYKTHPLLSKTQKLIIAVRVCQALRIIHQKGVIHADIKPDNILVQIEGKRIHVAIIDNGFSVIIGKNKVVIDEAKGTKGYIAPEIYNSKNPPLSKKEYSVASDIFALGMMFYKDLQLDKVFYENMIDEQPENRPSLDAIISSLLNTLTMMLESAKPPAMEKIIEAPKPPLDIEKPLEVSVPVLATPIKLSRRLPEIPKVVPKQEAADLPKPSVTDFRSQLASMLAKPAEMPDDISALLAAKKSAPRPLPARPYTLRTPIVPVIRVGSSTSSTFNSELEERLKSRLLKSINVL